MVDSYVVGFSRQLGAGVVSPGGMLESHCQRDLGEMVVDMSQLPGAIDHLALSGKTHPKPPALTNPTEARLEGPALNRPAAAHFPTSRAVNVEETRVKAMKRSSQHAESTITKIPPTN